MESTHPVVLITGASRGLGHATARIAGEYGASLVLSARSLDELEQLAGEINAQGGQAVAVPGDLEREEDCQRLVRTAIDRFGRLDSLVNNSGIIEPIAPIKDADLEGWQKNFAINYFAPVLLTRQALPSLRTRRGRVINISSGASVTTVRGWGAYSTSKAALNHFTDLLAAEEPEVTAIALRPGIVDTRMQAKIRSQGKTGMPEKDYQRLYQMYEQGRLLPPESPARAIACLALYAPSDWSGQFIAWDEQRVQDLIQEIARRMG